ncbi:MAG TPA: hypothetical protein VGS28_01570 [Candidatus Saccharimonadales bacterium]|nr:hypothetical protein [Candidatus Saccharimonadales bacterium]
MPRYEGYGPLYLPGDPRSERVKLTATEVGQFIQLREAGVLAQMVLNGLVAMDVIEGANTLIARRAYHLESVPIRVVRFNSERGRMVFGVSWGQPGLFAESVGRLQDAQDCWRICTRSLGRHAAVAAIETPGMPTLAHERCELIALQAQEKMDMYPDPLRHLDVSLSVIDARPPFWRPRPDEGLSRAGSGLRLVPPPDEV